MTGISGIFGFRNENRRVHRSEGAPGILVSMVVSFVYLSIWTYAKVNIFIVVKR